MSFKKHKELTNYVRVAHQDNQDGPQGSSTIRNAPRSSGDSDDSDDPKNVVCMTVTVL
jgi:hypothetical protein